MFPILNKEIASNTMLLGITLNYIVIKTEQRMID